MRRHLIYVIIMLIIMILLFANYTYAKDFTLNLTERGTNKTIQCILQTVNNNRVVICSEQNFTLGDPMPIKKQVVAPLKPKESTNTKPQNSNFLDAINSLRVK